MNRASHSLPYSINRWGQNYFSINSLGQLQFSIPSANSPAVPLTEIAAQISGAGLRLPALVRFTAILHDRVNSLVSAFNQTIETQHYQGNYQIVYPIKVNQQRRVIEEIAATEPARQQQQVGLEAGSKPELLAILALAQNSGTTIVCNGYKDRA
jgi:arginine decarboxylase